MCCNNSKKDPCKDPCCGNKSIKLPLPEYDTYRSPLLTLQLMMLKLGLLDIHHK